MMDKLNKAISLAMEEFKKENGQDARLEDGDEFATVFNDGILILGLECSELKDIASSTSTNAGSRQFTVKGVEAEGSSSI